MGKESFFLVLSLLVTTQLSAQDAALEVKCSKCSVNLSKAYDENHLAESNHCLEEEYSRMMGAPTMQEFRNYFEITGTYFKQQLAKGQEYSMTNEEVEQEKLKTAVWSGLSKYVWPIGATDCETHAKKLKQHLSETLPKDDFDYEVVSTFQEIDKTAFIDLKGSLSPMGNHYLVRAVSKKTGISYIVDGYTGPSVDSEIALEKKKIILNRYEECFFNDGMRAKLGLSPTDDILGMIATFTPVIKSSVARSAKQAAAACIKGVESVRINPDIL